MTKKVSFPSLDPIGKKTAYPARLISHKRFTREDADLLMDTSPFETLPRVFLPIAGRYLPPLFYYGWSVSSMDLYTYALKHDLIRDALAEITNKPAATIDIPSAEEVDGSIRLDVADYVVLTAAEKCGITIQPMADSQIMPAFGDGDVATVFVLYDNHHFNYALTAEQVQVLQAKLERANPPK